jgi:hypothetical protein
MSEVAAITKPERASWVRAWVDSVKGQAATAAKEVVAAPVGQRAGSVLEQYAWASGTSAALAVAESTVGLDQHGFQVDGALAGVAAIAAIVSPGIGEAARNVGASACGYWVGRNVRRMLGRESSLRTVVKGEVGPKKDAMNGENDPIVSRAESLGIKVDVSK